MRRNKSWILAIMATALLAFAAGGCVEPLENNGPGIDPDAVKLPIRLYIPGAMLATKASPGDVDGVHPESQIYSVQVWMFNHYAATSNEGDGETAVAYAVADNLTGQTANLPNGSGYYKGTNGYTQGGWTDADTYELTMWIPGHVIDRPDEDMKFDFYVLANGESIGCTADQSTTRGALKAMSFGYTSETVDDQTVITDFFGVTSPKTGTSPEVTINGSVGANGPGLPISGFFNKANNSDTEGKGIDLSILKTRDIVSPDDVHTYSPIVQLKRAVSKVRFVFAAPTGMTNVSVTGITLDGEIIPEQTYTFPREDGTGFLLPGGTDRPYSSSTASVVVPETIGRIDDPNFLRSTNKDTLAMPSTLFSGLNWVTDTDAGYYGKTPNAMSAQDYSDYLTAAVAAGKATESYVYLRESDKPVTGTITYSLDGGTTTKTATFYMPSPVTDETNFHRNHTWTVYAYFNGGLNLEIWPYAMRWIYHETTTSFSSQVQCDEISVTGAIENTQAYMDAHGGKSNHYLSNFDTGEVPSVTDVDYYDKYYQIRRLDVSEDALGYFQFEFTPRAPYGGYWRLDPVFFGEDSQDMFRFEVQLADGGTSSVLEGQIIDRKVTIKIYPSSSYNYASDLRSHSVIFKSYFSPTRNFEPAYSADSEVQDVHGDGRYSYWRFTLTHGDH